MADLNSKTMKERSLRRLSELSTDPRKLVLIHTGLIVLLNLIVNGLNLFLSQQIGTTGGLSGLGMRSVLQTAQTVLGYFATFFTPFWAAGFLYSMIRIARGQNAGFGDLLQGFRRFWRILSYVLWEMLLFMALCTILMYVCTFVYLLTPFASGFMEILEPLMSEPNLFLADGSLNMELLPMDQTFSAMLPLVILYGILAAAAYTLLSYHFRMVTFLLVEGIDRSAFAAFLVSIKLMKGHKWQLFKLDLSFWWYYALEVLLTIVLYLDLILPLLGITLPFDPTVGYFITLILYGVLELGLHLWKKAEVDTTYACAYEAIYRDFVPLENEQ